MMASLIFQLKGCNLRPDSSKGAPAYHNRCSGHRKISGWTWLLHVIRSMMRSTQAGLLANNRHAAMPNSLGITLFHGI